MTNIDEARQTGLRSARGYFAPKHPRLSFRIAVYAAIIAITLGILGIHGWIVYDDWTCAWKRCVEVKP